MHTPAIAWRLLREWSRVKRRPRHPRRDTPSIPIHSTWKWKKVTTRSVSGTRTSPRISSAAQPEWVRPISNERGHISNGTGSFSTLMTSAKNCNIPWQYFVWFTTPVDRSYLGVLVAGFVTELVHGQRRREVGSRVPVGGLVERPLRYLQVMM